MLHILYLVLIRENQRYKKKKKTTHKITKFDILSENILSESTMARVNGKTRVKETVDKLNGKSVSDSTG